MDTISLNCAKCKQALKFPPARAGTKGKCTRCGTELTVPSVTAKPPAPAGMDEDDGPMTYGLVETQVEKKKAPDEKKQEKKKSVIEKRKKTLKDAGSWALARHGFVLMNVGAMIWLGIYALQMLVVLFGSTQGMEYNTLRLNVLMAGDPDNPPPPPAPGEMENLDVCRFAVALVSGEAWLSLAMAVHILLAIAVLVQIACFMMGYFTCLSVPERFGARSQVKAMIVLAIINVCIIVVFRLLALLGVSYTILPYLVPEIPTLQANMERMTPIHLAWCNVPFLDVLLTLIFICCQWAECTLGASFLRTVGMSIKDEPIKESGTTLVYMAMGAGFVFICYHIVSLNGASDVLINVLRLLYLLVVGAQFLFIYSYMRLLLATHATFNKLLEDWVPSETDNEDEDDEDEDEDDEDSKPKRKKSKRKRDEEDEDEKEDDDDDEDDDDEEDRPRKRKKR